MPARKPSGPTCSFWSRRWVEGDRNARLRLHRKGWDFEKIRKYGLKWALWFLIGMATGGAWVFYFADAPTLAVNLVTGEAPMIAYITILILTMTTFLFGGFFREQICIYACPWPRIQAAMMDEDTLTIDYRDWRGEPRGKHRKAEGAEQFWAIASTAWLASTCAPWASTSAMVSKWPVSPVACALMPATR